MLSRLMSRRLEIFAREAYRIAGFEVEFKKCSTMWLQEPVKTGAITDEEIAELKCKYVCAVA